MCCNMKMVDSNNDSLRKLDSLIACYLFYMHKTHKIEWTEISHLKNCYSIVDKNEFTNNSLKGERKSTHEMTWLHFSLSEKKKWGRKEMKSEWNWVCNENIVHLYAQLCTHCAKIFPTYYLAKWERERWQIEMAIWSSHLKWLCKF